MKELRNILLLAILLLSEGIAAGTSLISQDKDWLGGKAEFNTTEGNDFWLTFMNNGMFDATNPENKNKPFEMQVIISAREAMSVMIDIGTTNVTTLNLNAGETQIYTIDKETYAKTIYLFKSENRQEGYKGVHVYAAQKDKDKFFSCFTYNRTGDIADSYREASLILPTRSLGKEYYIQNSPQDNFSSEFAIVATEDGTTVQYSPSDTTFTGQLPYPATPYTVTLNKGDAYMVASKTKKEGFGDYVLDLSGSFICADKPIAVFNGNQQTSIPISVTKARNFATEQSLPIAQWGTEFYITKLERTKINYFRITAAYDNTNITVKTENNTAGSTLTLAQKGQSTSIDEDYIVGVDANEFVITSDHPVILYSYTSSAHDNDENVTIDGRSVKILWGNSANAMMPSWSHRAKSMNFFTHELDPEKVLGKTPPQEFYIYLVTKTSDVGKVTVDGSTVSFKPFVANTSMSYAHVEVGNTNAYHHVETTGDGFVGMVYALTHAQPYFYTLGYTPDPYGDSLFINNEQALMSPKSYDMDSLDGHGWYQRQWNEWTEGKGRLDTAIVCDSSTVYWTIETPEEKPVTGITWNLYDVTDGKREIVSDDIFPFEDNSVSATKHKHEYQFILPEEEDIKKRHQFIDYELEIILHRSPIICENEDLDTLRSVTRVTRIFNDTTWRAICMGDTLQFFNDSLYTQGDLTKYKAGEKQETKFVATKATTTDIPEWQWFVNTGKYTFTRQYQSQFGCDSIVTLELFVCDTFRFVDTIHLCSNQDTLYHGHTYYGKEYTEGLGPKPQRVTQDTSVFYINLKTDSCDCQKGELKNKYKDIQGFSFRGCDSIYELHVIMHPSYDLHVTDTLDFKKNPDSTYVWKIERDGITRDSLITKYSRGMYWSDRRQAWIGEFGDTLRTKTCKECNNGNPQGCDSINSLKLIIPKVYRFEEEIVWCRLSYDWSTHTAIQRDFQWKGHHSDITYTKGGDYYDSCYTRYGADSIYHLHLVYSQAETPIYDLVKMTVCRDTVNRTLSWTSNDGYLTVDTIPQDSVGHFYFVDDSRCDSIYALELTVLPTYFIIDPVKMTQEDVYFWEVNGKRYGGPKTTKEYDILVTEPETTVTIPFQTTAVNETFCDSTRQLIIHMGTVYRDTIEAFACGNDDRFVWEETRPEYMRINEQGEKEPFERMTIYAANLPQEYQTLIYKDPYKTILNDDSVFYLKLYRAPKHYMDTTIGLCQDTVNLFTWDEGHESHDLFDVQTGKKVKATEIPIRLPGDYYYIDSLQTDSFLCDSIWMLHLHVDPIFYKDTTVSVCQFEPYEWLNGDQDSIIDANGHKIEIIPTEHIGDYKYDVMFHTTYGCDSVWHLTLHIDTVYSMPVDITPRFMCDKDTIQIFDLVIYGIKSPLRPEGVGGIAVPEDAEFIEVDTLHTVKTAIGCDSVVQHRIQVYKTYLDEQEAFTCQPLEGQKPFYHWEDHDTIWDVQRGKYITADSIPTNVPGGVVYTYIDSLRTSTCAQCHKGRMGCDSLFVLHLRVDSVYEYHNELHICENERAEWQKKRYTGDKAPDMDSGDTLIFVPGIYHDTVQYETRNHCDSIYYLTLHVHKIFHTQLTDTVYDNEDKHYYEFTDTRGSYYRDYVPFKPHKPVLEEDTLITYYLPKDTILEHTLLSADGGCDSIVTLQLTILPTYRFVAKGKGCWGDNVPWRGNEYSSSGIYYDSLKTIAGGDSVFVLEFLVKPVSLISISRTICESETFVHRDTIHYASGEEYAVFETEVWKPGNVRPDPYAEVIFKSHDGGCDSLIYRYHLTICDTFMYFMHASICSGDTFYSDELNHAWKRYTYEFDTDTFVLPYDTTYIDSLKTIKGCDSLYILHAHVLPAYRHIVYDTICENETYQFRDITVVPLASGDTIVRDHLYTKTNNCDSIYELRLSVYPKYFKETYDTICANETYTWRDHFIEHAAIGDTLVYDSLLTRVDCDSVFHLYLTVMDTTREEHFDTICYGDTLFVTETGHFYTEAGDYVDTTLNEWGCHHFIYHHIELIPPTIPTIWAEDPMCQNQTAFELYYTYTNRKPIAYSLYFDETGRSMGFEDMIDVPIDQYTNPMVITVPIPYSDKDDPTTYPKPDKYAVRLVLDNGKCLHKEQDCYHDSTFIMHYPKWIIEQRYGDVIGILNERHNGGYRWSAYQWYQGDTKLIGQTQPYLHIPSGLTLGAEYYVQLTREGETESIPTCPITIEQISVVPEYAPTMGYLSVTPTCVVPGHPFVSILSRKDGTYRISSSSGRLVSQGVFKADVTEVEVPSDPGMYIIQLWSYDTPEEPYRAMKIMVREQCENCATSF